MLKKSHIQYALQIDLKGQPLTPLDIETSQKQLRSTYRSHLSFVIAIFALGLGVSYRALTLNYDTEFELFNLSLYVGMWFGLFAGVMIDGNTQRKLQLIVVGIILCSSASLFASMLMTLFIGHITVWISSINILASALSSMWLMTYYDEILKGIESVKTVDEKGLCYIKKASSHFEELNQFSEQIREQGRMPLVAEYWAYREWIKVKVKSNG
ncbi:hypothetical protein GCM10009133_32150 [Cocleimonas flava]|uniref:Uncharacterized protein n=1 Tax=Cocleimonas flava TaxID=634765 RepID=A0A4R1F614_9GAMM|nr:hypothetical protein [Cocleimonas flava]TCJ88940.1 hypothetical protein EV695_0800 [Cocleimonas flava]